MATPQEPLLPVEPAPPPRARKGILLAASAVVLLAAAGVAILTHRRGIPAEGSSASDSRARSGSSLPDRAAGEVVPPGEKGRSLDELRAAELYRAAEAFERAEPGDYEKRMARWREVVTTFPQSTWARKAEERYRTASASLETFLNREFDRTRQDAQALSAAGHFVDAIDRIKSYKGEQTRDLLRRRADAEIEGIENSSRLAYNEAVAKAKSFATGREFPAAISLFEAMGPGAIPEVSARCQSAVLQLRKAQAEHLRYREFRSDEEARRSFREGSASKLLELVRGRRYEEALQELSSAASHPAQARIRAEIVAERALVADASSFWEAFLKAVRSRIGQDALVLLADGRRLPGKVSRIQPDRMILETADGTVEAPFDQLHADLVVGWTLGRVLPAQDPVSYSKAAMFFFCEGRDELAKLYLATVHELGGAAELEERTFRRGILRSAMTVRK